MGQSLSNPITAQHIERHNTDLFRSAVDHVCGFRGDQEDAHTIEYNVNGEGLSIVAVYDGHGGARCAQWLQQNIPLFFAPLVTATMPDQVGSIPLNEDINIAVGEYFLDDRFVYEDILTTLMYTIDAEFLRYAESFSIEDGSTAVITLLQPWDLVNNKAILDFSTPFSYAHRDTVGVKIISINIGDSRSLIIRNTEMLKRGEDEFIYCTEDHKPTDPIERARIYASGGVVQNNRVDGSLALSRAFGDIAYKAHKGYSHYAQIPPAQRRVCVTPGFSDHIAFYGDILFVACDGLFESDLLGNVEPLPQIIKYNKDMLIGPCKASDEFAQLCFDPAVIARNLIQESIAFGSKDNHTAIIVSLAGIPNDLPALLTANLVEEEIVAKVEEIADAQEDCPSGAVDAKAEETDEAKAKVAEDAADPVKVANTMALKKVVALEQLNSVVLVPGPTWCHRGEGSDSTLIEGYKRDMGSDEFERLSQETTYLNEVVAEKLHYDMQNNDGVRGARDLLMLQNFNVPHFDAQSFIRNAQLIPLNFGIPPDLATVCDGVPPIAFEKMNSDKQSQSIPPQLLQMMLNSPYGMGMDDQ